MNKQPISIKGSYSAPECEVTTIGTSKIFCASGAGSVENLTYEDYDSTLGDL